MSKILTLESELPNMKASDLFATAPHIIALGRELILATILPESQSNTLISFLPEPPANNRSYFWLNIVTYKNGAMDFPGLCLIWFIFFVGTVEAYEVIRDFSEAFGFFSSSSVCSSVQGYSSESSYEFSSSSMSKRTWPVPSQSMTFVLYSFLRSQTSSTSSIL